MDIKNDDISDKVLEEFFIKSMMEDIKFVDACRLLEGKLVELGSEAFKGFSSDELAGLRDAFTKKNIVDSKD